MSVSQSPVRTEASLGIESWEREGEGEEGVCVRGGGGGGVWGR